MHAQGRHVAELLEARPRPSPAVGQAVAGAGRCATLSAMTAPGPSPWVARFASLAAPGGPVLDVACGGGRHTPVFLARGHPGPPPDRDTNGLADIRFDPAFEIVETG